MAGINLVRLADIRIACKLTSAQLAKLIDVTKQAVSKYENGQSSPSSSKIDKMISVLEVPRHYINKPTANINNQSALFFRKDKATLQTTIKYASIQAKWAYEILESLSKYVKLPTVNLPALGDTTDIEEKGMHLRRYWNLGSAPIMNLIETLEQNGLMIFTINSKDIGVDAYSKIINEKPIIIINKSNGTAVQWRFSLAHELGHIVLHSNILDQNLAITPEKYEKEANQFASSFLMPGDSFRHATSGYKLQDYVPLKKEWKVSVAEMVCRSYQLGIIDEERAEKLRVQISKKGWRKHEPLDDEVDFESPHYISIVFDNALADDVAIEGFLNDLRLPYVEIATLCSLDKDYFKHFNLSSHIDSNEGKPVQLSFFEEGW